MKRRHFLKTAAAIPVVWSGCSQATRAAAGPLAPLSSRVRPGDPGWPSPASWEKLKQAVHGRLIELHSPLAACRKTPDGAACAKFFQELKNPYFIGDEPALTQTSGWLDAWTSAPSVYAVAAANTADVAAAVNFALRHNLRLVVKGGGHSYQGTSKCARFPFDLDAEDERHRVARCLCPKWRCRKSRAAAGRHGGRRHDLGASL